MVFKNEGGRASVILPPIECKFAAGQSWNPIISEYLLKKGIPWSADSGLIDLIIQDDLNKKIVLVEFKDTDLHSSLYGGKVNIKAEFGRMIKTATEYKLKGYLVECYCIYIQPSIPKRVLAHDYPQAKTLEDAKDLYINDLLQDQATVMGFLNDERVLLSICADFGIKPKAYGNKQNAAEFAFKRIMEPWGVDLSIPIKDGKTDVPLLDKWLSDIDGVSPEKAQEWAALFNHKINEFMSCWVEESGTFCYKIEEIYPKLKDGTPSAQYAKLYSLFFDDQ